MHDLDPTLRPGDRAEGYAIQAAMARYGSPFGWKIAATSEAGQKHINVAGPQAGRIFGERVIADGGTAPMAGNEMRVGEPEFAFRMGRDSPPRPTAYSVEEVLRLGRHPASGDRIAGLALRRFHRCRRSAVDRRQRLRASICTRATDDGGLARGRSGRAQARGDVAPPALCRSRQECARRSAGGAGVACQ